jgi:hypothetical protein
LTSSEAVPTSSDVAWVLLSCSGVAGEFAASLTATGVSLVPLIVIVTSCATVPPAPSSIATV